MSFDPRQADLTPIQWKALHVALKERPTIPIGVSPADAAMLEALRADPSSQGRWSDENSTPTESAPRGFV